MELKNKHTGEVISTDDASKIQKLLGSANYEELKAKVEPVKEVEVKEEITTKFTKKSK